MSPARRPEHPARPAFGRAVAFCLGALAALSLLAAGCGRYVPGTIAPATRRTQGAAWDGDVAVSPDGKQVVFVSERANGRRGLYVLDARDGGAAPRPLAVGDFDVSMPAWSHDGSRVSFTRADSAGGATQLYDVPAAVPAQRALGPVPAPLALGPGIRAAMDAAHAPDGSEVALVARGDSTFALGTWSAAGGFRPLVDAGTGEAPRHPTWGRKGEGLAYAKDGALWWIARAGGAPVRLTAGPSRASEPAFSPDGRWLAFVSDTSGVANVWLARFTRDDRRGPALGPWRPVTASFQPVGHPAWAPDGHALWYERQDPWSIAACATNLPVQGSPGGPVGAPDTVSASLFDSRAPSYSGDATHVAFASTRSGGWNVFAMAAAGEASSGPARPLTQGDAHDANPRWSRASGQVAFERDDSLALTDPTGAVLGALGPGRAPAWSPDGRALAYVSADGRLMTMEGVGRTGRVLTASGVIARDPCWGAGELAGAIVFAAPDSAHVALWRMPAAGGAATLLTSDPVAGAADSEPAVSPDGQWICFTRQRRGDRDLWLINTRVGRARSFVANPRGQEGHAEWSPDGRRLVYETGGAVNLYRADVRPLLLR